MNRFSYYLWLSLLSLSLAVCAQSDKPHKQANMPTSLSVENQPPRNAEEVSLRFLNLLENIKTTKELTPELIQKVMGLQIHPRQDNPNNFDASGQLTQDWYYGLSVFDNYFSSTNEPALMFEFMPTPKKPDADMTDVCDIDLEGYHQRLLEMGFTHTGNTREGLRSRQYKRGELSINVGYAGESMDKIDHKCVVRVDVR